MRWMSARRPRALNSAAMWRAGIRRASARPPNKFDPGPGSKKRDETRFAAPWPRRPPGCCQPRSENHRSEEHTSELQSLMRISYAVFCLKKKNNKLKQNKKKQIHTNLKNKITSKYTRLS